MKFGRTRGRAGLSSVGGRRRRARSAGALDHVLGLPEGVAEGSLTQGTAGADELVEFA